MNLEAIRAFVQKEYFGNSLQEYAVSLLVFIVVYLAAWVVKTFIIGRLRRMAEKTKTGVDDFLIGLFRHVGPLVYFLLALYFATRSLDVSEGIARILQILFVVILTYKAVQFAQEVVTFFVKRWAARAELDDPTSAVVVGNLLTITRVVLWAGGFVFAFDNLGYEITSIVAGLGVGGIAVALAAQTVLGDAFNSFAIFMDKPFKVGDFIIVGDMLGTVEHVGFKTTRIRSLGGEQLVFSNSDLTTSRIRNYKRMETRRIVFTFGVIYQTPVEKVKAIPGIVEEIVKNHELTRFDRAHFRSFGDSALVYEVVYYVLTPDYNRYMDVQQYINVGIMEAFQKRGIEFAYPTQQLFVTQAQPAA